MCDDEIAAEHRAESTVARVVRPLCAVVTPTGANALLRLPSPRNCGQGRVMPLLTTRIWPLPDAGYQTCYVVSVAQPIDLLKLDVEGMSAGSSERCLMRTCGPGTSYVSTCRSTSRIILGSSKCSQVRAMSC